MPATWMTSVTVSAGVAGAAILPGRTFGCSEIFADRAVAETGCAVGSGRRVSVGRGRWLDVVLGWRRDIGTRAPLRGRQRGQSPEYMLSDRSMESHRGRRKLSSRSGQDRARIGTPSSRVLALGCVTSAGYRSSPLVVTPSAYRLVGWLGLTPLAPTNPTWSVGSFDARAWSGRPVERQVSPCQALLAARPPSTTVAVTHIAPWWWRRLERSGR